MNQNGTINPYIYFESNKDVDNTQKKNNDKDIDGDQEIINGEGNPKYTTKIKWGINDIEARPYGKGYNNRKC